MQIQCKVSDSKVDVFVLLFCASVRCRMPGEIKKERARERERGGWKREKGRKRERELVHQRHQQVNRPQSLKTKMSVLDEECIYYWDCLCMSYLNYFKYMALCNALLSRPKNYQLCLSM